MKIKKVLSGAVWVLLAGLLILVNAAGDSAQEALAQTEGVYTAADGEEYN